MIIMKIQGGLGNQLFQYALGRNLAYKNNTTLKLDISWYRTQEYRSFELDQFNIQADIATDAEVLSFAKYKKRGRKILFWYNWLIADESKYVREKTFIFNSHILDIKDDTYLDGVWPFEKYFQNIADIIRSEFTLKNPLGSVAQTVHNDILTKESISICIRRGDFVSIQKVHDIHGLLPMDYYREAVKIISARVKNPHFFVFSDDIEWVKENFTLDHPVTYVSDGHMRISSTEEFVLMSHCKHTVSANSSFSWWAGWLNKNPSKIVIFPQKWFKDESRNSPDLIPSSWITIPNTHL